VGSWSQTQEGDNFMTLKIIITGGTFDKEYNELSGELFFKETHIDEMLQRARCRVALDVEALMMIDSLEMTDEDRTKILKKCQSISSSQIVITHGTDTMEVTAQYLGKRVKDKTIVLTGAMIPYKFGSSDGLFNLGSALSFAQSLPYGVYIAMNGRCFLWDKVRKNKESGYFEELSRA
jgi:L-asparaginase